MRNFIIILGIFSSISTFGQYKEETITGRPGQASGPLGVGRNVFQLQSGFYYGGTNYDNKVQTSDYIAQNLVLRFGLSERIEVNGTVELRKDEIELAESVNNYSGLSTASLGARFHVFGKESGKSALGVQFNLGLPIKQEEYNSDYMSTSLSLLTSIPVANNLGFTGNLGVSYDGNSPEPKGTYIAQLSYSFAEGWSAFIENYGNFDQSDFQNRWDTGIGWSVNDQLKLDAFGGFGSNDKTDDYFISVGVSYRFLTFRENTDSQK